MTRRCAMEWVLCDRCPDAVPSVHDGIVKCDSCGRSWESPRGSSERCPHPAVEVIDGISVCSGHARWAKREKRMDSVASVIGGGISLVMVAGIGAATLGALYLLVRFIRWAWVTP